MAQYSGPAAVSIVKSLYDQAPVYLARKQQIANAIIALPPLRTNGVYKRSGAIHV